jgi:hypothetical protein
VAEAIVAEPAETSQVEFRGESKSTSSLGECLIDAGDATMDDDVIRAITANQAAQDGDGGLFDGTFRARLLIT